MKLNWAMGMVLFLASVISGVAQTTALAKTLSPTEQAAIAAEKSFLAAIKKGDPGYLKRTLADDFQFVGFDGQVNDREATLDMFSDGGVDLTPYNFKVVTAGDGMAIVTYDAILKVPPEEDQGPPPRYQHFSSVWVKVGDAWILKFQQTTPTHWGDW